MSAQIAAENPAIVAKSVWMLGGPGPPQQARGMRQAGANCHNITMIGPVFAIDPDQDAGCPQAISRGQHFNALRIGQQREIAGRQRRAYGGDLGIHFGIQRAIMRIASGTKDAGTTIAVIDRGRYRGHHRTGFFQSLDQGHGPRLMFDRRPGIRGSTWWLGRIAAGRAMDTVQRLRLLIVRLEILVGDRLGGRDATAMLDLLEVGWAKPV